MSSVTVKQFNFPSLHLIAARGGFDEPPRCRRVFIDGAAHLRAHENADTSATLGGELETARLDSIQPIDRRYRGADAAAAQAFRNRPEPVVAIRAAQQQ